jgi:hypothetical protein
MGKIKKLTSSVKSATKKAVKATSKFAEGKTGNKLIDVGQMALAGDLYGLQQEGFKQLGKAIGKKNLRKAQNFGEKTMGEKNYKTTARVVKRGNRIGANAASAYLAYARGDPITATKYGGDVAEASIGTKALRKAHGAVEKTIGKKNYESAMKGYKGARHGVALGYNLAHLSHMNDAYAAKNTALNAAKLGLAGSHVVNSAEKAYSYMSGLKTEAEQSKKMQQSQPSVTTNKIKVANVIGKGGVRSQN